MKNKKPPLTEEHVKAREILLNTILRLFPDFEEYASPLYGTESNCKEGFILRVALFGCLLKTNCCYLSLKDMRTLMENKPKGKNVHSLIIHWKHVINGTKQYSIERRNRILDIIAAVEKNLSHEYLLSLVDIDGVSDKEKFNGETNFCESDPEGYPLDVVLTALLLDDKGRLIKKKEYEELKNEIEHRRQKFISKFKSELSTYYLNNGIIPISVVVETVEQNMSSASNEYVQEVRKILFGTALFPAYLL